MMLTLVLWLATLTAQPADSIRLELRIFDGTTEITRDARVRLYTAGRRDTPIPTDMTADGALTAYVPVGRYDVQAIRVDENGSVAGLRWADGLIVQSYPGEGNRQLQVVNLKRGFGALQIRGASPGGGSLAASIYPAGDHARESTKPVQGDGYLLFVLPAGRYDVLIRGTGATPTWLNDIEVPLDRTRVEVVPGSATP